jgi:ankyrin repeat protein
MSNNNIVHSTKVIEVTHDGSSTCICKRPLLLACAQGHCTKVQQALSDASLDVNERGPHGMRPLQYVLRAATDCTSHIVKMLLVCGADANGTDDASFSALVVNAIWAPNEEHAMQIARQLVDHGADPDVPTCDGRMAHEFALGNGMPRLAAWLCEPSVRESRREMKAQIRSVTEAMAKGRIICGGGDRGPLFGQLTHWLDIELIQALAGRRVSEAQCRKILAAIRKGRFFDRHSELVAYVLGSRFNSLVLNS